VERSVVGPIAPLEVESGVEEAAPNVARVRIFAGYAGWGEGQLDAEIEEGDWIAHAPQPEDVFTEEPDGLWSEVLTRKGGSYALIARMPADPSLN
jgi:putative transcriptional regulator